MRATSLLLACLVALSVSPALAADYYVDPLNGLDVATGGSASLPWKTAQYAVNRIAALPPAAQAGAVLNLRANVLYPRTVFPAGLRGTPEQPIVVRPYDGGRVVFDAGEERFRQPGAWEPVPDQTDEWRTKDPFELNPRDPVSNGQFTDTRLRLIKYGHIGDFRAANQSYHVVPLSDPRPGLTLANRPTHKVPFMYLGPGVHYVFENEQKTRGRVHIRLSPTSFGTPGIEDYRWSTPPDPNALALSIARKDAVAVIVGAQNVVFRNVTFQNGGDVTLQVNSAASNVTFDHCEVYGARHGVGVSGSNVRFHHCTFDGGLAPWTTRSDVKNTYDYPPDGECEPNEKTGHCTNNLGANTHDILIMHSGSGGGYVHCTFRRAHDGIQLSGDDNEIRDSLFEDINDEVVQLMKRGTAESPIPTLANTRIHGNVFRQVMHPVSFALNPIGGPVYFYRNVVDQRVPTRGFRTLPPDAPAPWIWRYGADVKDGPTVAYHAYHNTFIASQDVDKGSYVSRLFYGDPPVATTFLNNVSLALDVDRPLSRVPSASVDAVSNGNVWYRYEVFPDPLAPRPLWVHGPQKFFSLAELWAAFPAWEAQSQYADPQLANFTDESFEYQAFYPNTDVRPLAGGPAHAGGVVLPAGLPDDFPSGGAPDVGARPVGAPVMAVGVDAATLLPAPGVPVALAGTDQTIVDADGDGFEVAPLDGSGSSDADGLLTAHDWSLRGTALASGAQVPVHLPEGDHHVRLVVTDDAGKLDSDAVHVRVLPVVPGENRLASPGFEESPSEWQLGPGAAVTGAKGAAHSGRFAVQMTPSFYKNPLRQRVAVSLGAYTVSGWIKTALSGIGEATLSVSVLDADGAVLLSQVFAHQGGKAPYTYHQVVVQPLKGAAFIEVAASLGGSASGRAFFDDLRIRDRNVLKNGRFEVRSANGQEEEAPGWGFVRGGLVIDDPENVRSGRYALALVPTDTYHLITQEAIHTSPGGYRVSAWVKTTGLSAAPTVKVVLLGSSGQTLATRALTVPLSEGQYGYVSRTLAPSDMPVGTASLSLVIELPQLTDGTAFIDDVMVEPLP